MAWGWCLSLRGKRFDYLRTRWLTFISWSNRRCICSRCSFSFRLSTAWARCCSFCRRRRSRSSWRLCVSMNIHVWGIRHDLYGLLVLPVIPKLHDTVSIKLVFWNVSVFFCPYNGSQSGLVASFVFCRQVWNDRTVSKWQNSYIWVTVPLRWIFGNTCDPGAQKSSVTGVYL